MLQFFFKTVGLLLFLHVLLLTVGADCTAFQRRTV